MPARKGTSKGEVEERVREIGQPAHCPLIRVFVDDETTGAHLEYSAHCNGRTGSLDHSSGTGVALLFGQTGRPGLPGPNN